MLHYAVKNHDLEIVELLLLLGADVHATKKHVSSQHYHQPLQAFTTLFTMSLACAMHQLLDFAGCRWPGILYSAHYTVLPATL